MNRVDFFLEMMRSIKTTGTVTQSSKFAAKKMIKPVNFSTAKYLVELGAGNGVITKHILEKMRPDAKLLAFEINPKLCEEIKKIDDSRLILIEDSAEKLDFYLEKHQMPQADHVISALPLSLIPDEIRDNIIDEVVKNLGKNGFFVQIQYSPVSLKILKQKFEKVKVGFVARNLPPALLYYCNVKAA